MKISFIIPVYNAEKYLARCIDSILEQYFVDFEIVLVNDGSTDNSADICSHYKEKDKRVIVINQKNSGPSTARNAGIDQVNGDYIWFVDADDYIKPHILNRVVSEIDVTQNIDIINFSYCYFDGYKEVIRNSKYKMINFAVGLDYLDICNGELYLWNRLYKCSFVKNNNLKFIDGVKNIEDFIFNVKAFIIATQIATIDMCCYVYNTANISSTSRKRTPTHLYKLASDTITVHDELNMLLLKSKNERCKQIISKLLNKSCAGFLYSLLRYKYDLSYINSILILYSDKGLYPIRMVGDRKTDCFLYIANNRFLFLFISFVFRVFPVR